MKMDALYGIASLNGKSRREGTMIFYQSIVVRQYRSNILTSSKGRYALKSITEEPASTRFVQGLNEVIPVPS